MKTTTTNFSDVFVSVLNFVLNLFFEKKSIYISKNLQNCRYEKIYVQDGKVYGQEPGHKPTVLKIGKILPYCIGAEYKQYIEVLASYFASELRRTIVDVSRVLVSGNVSSVYTIPTSKIGKMGSCMQSRDSEKFQIYDSIERCDIAYILDSQGNLEARALVWYDVILKDKGWADRVHIVDTVYYCSDAALQTILQWAKEQGYLVKTSQSLHCFEFVNQTSGKKYNLEGARVYTGFEFVNNLYKDLPYIDTFFGVTKGKDYIYCPGPKNDYMENTANKAIIRGFGEWSFLTYPELKKEEVCPNCSTRISASDKRVKYGKDCCVHCEGKVHRCKVCGDVVYQEVRIKGVVTCGKHDCREIAKMWTAEYCPICGKVHTGQKYKVYSKIYVGNKQWVYTTGGRSYRRENEYMEICVVCLKKMMEEGKAKYEIYNQWWYNYCARSYQHHAERDHVDFAAYYKEEMDKCWVYMFKDCLIVE